jgi:uncharacterized protein
MRVKPSLPKGLLVLVGYLAVVFTVWIATDIDYDTIGDSVENVREAVTLAMFCGLIYLVIVVSALGWWKPALREARRVHHGWMWVIPVLLALGVVLNLASTEWGRFDELGTKIGPYVLWLALGCAMVGFNEELATRGQLIVGARGSVHEVWVWFTASLCFGLMHVPNFWFGEDGKTTVQQVFLAFTVGTAYYVTRRVTGSLIVTMVLHGAWDFSTFIQGHSVDGMAEKTIALGGALSFPLVAIALIAVFVILRKDGDVVEPGGDQLAPFEEATTAA